MDCTLFHINKCILYYIEFIIQIQDNASENNDLGLKDAILFLYTKTIYNFNANSNFITVKNENRSEILKITDLNINILIVFYSNTYNNVLTFRE